jgi:hypothetical protein
MDKYCLELVTQEIKICVYKYVFFKLAVCCSVVGLVLRNTSLGNFVIRRMSKSTFAQIKIAMRSPDDTI